MREGCRRALTRAGFDTDTASDLPEALALLRRNTYELFLLDVMLPGGSGLDLLDPILSRDPDALCELAERLGDDLELWASAAEALGPNDPRLAVARARVKRLEASYAEGATAAV